MRKITAGLTISLDGVVESPANWGFRFLTEEMNQIIDAGIAKADAILLGRRTYLEFSALWPTDAALTSPLPISTARATRTRPG